MKFILAIFLFAAGPAHSDVITICFNYECGIQTELDLDHSELRRAARLFVDVDDAASERQAISQAVAILAGIAASRTPIANDQGGNAADEGVHGRMDCIDHSRTTTEYLQLLERRRWIRFHRVLGPAVRAPLLVNVHWAARLEEIPSGAQFTVDTWFRPNGFPVPIFNLEEWSRGAVPHDSDATIGTFRHGKPTPTPTPAIDG